MFAVEVQADLPEVGVRLPRRFAGSREGPARRGASACRGGSCSPWRSTKLRLAGEVPGLLQRSSRLPAACLK